MGLEIDRETFEPHESDDFRARLQENIVALRCCRSRATAGAQWQRRRLATLEDGRPNPTTLVKMLEAYLERAAAGAPVHHWT